MTFSSKDFGKTKPQFEVQIPEKLIHKNVINKDSKDNRFSEERKHPVFVVDLPTKNLSMTVGGLDPSQTTNRHRHTYETVIYIIKGEGVTTVEGREVHWSAGDALYIPQWAWHHHRNKNSDSECVYLACENAPQMQNLGVAIREEAA